MMLGRRIYLMVALVLVISLFSAVRGKDTSSSLFDRDGSKRLVESLTRNTFISDVMETRSPHAVFFYTADSCETCEAAAQKFETAAAKLHAWGVGVGSVDLQGESRLARDLGVPVGVPEPFLRVYHGESTPNPYGGLPVRAHLDMRLAEDARGVQRGVLSAIPDNVATVQVNMDPSSGSSRAEELKEVLQHGDNGYAAVLLTSAGKASPMLRVLSSELRGTVDAIQARVIPRRKDDTEEGEGGGEAQGTATVGSDEVNGVIMLLAEAWNLDAGVSASSFPVLVFFDKKAGTGRVYSGDTDSAKDISAFIHQEAGISSIRTDGDKADESDRQGFYADGVLELEPARLMDLVSKGVEALVVAVVAEAPAQGMDDIIPGWEDATKGLQGQVRAAIADCGRHPLLCEGGSVSRKPPHIRVYPHGAGVNGNARDHPSVFTSNEIQEALADAEASLPEYVTVIPEGLSPEIAQEAVRSFIGSSIGAENDPMIMLVLSKKSEPNLMVKTIAAQFHDAGIKVLFMSKPPQELAASLGVPKIPAMVLMFPSPEAPDAGEGQVAFATSPYFASRWGPLGHKNVSEFILFHLSQVSREAFFKQLKKASDNAQLNGETFPDRLRTMLQENSGSVEEDDYSQGSDPRGHDNDTGTLETSAGVSEASFESWARMVPLDESGELGGPSPRMIGVFLLDRYADNFDVVRRTAEAAAGKAVASAGAGVRFVWVDAPCQEGFAQSLGVRDTAEVPVLAVLSPKHQRLARFVGAWEANSLSSFLKQALGGRSPMHPMDGLPTMEDSDCSQRPGPGDAGTGDEADESGVDDDGLMSDLMSEILAEEEKAKRELEAEVEKDLNDLKEGNESNGNDKQEEELMPKKRTKVVRRKKKKKASTGGGSEL